MSATKTNDAFWWSLFGAGGTLTALLLPAHILLFGIAIPLGMVAAPEYEGFLDLVRHPLARIYFFVLISLSLMHWAHRFRFLMDDLFHIENWKMAVATGCYGLAVAGTLLAAYLVLSL